MFEGSSQVPPYWSCHVRIIKFLKLDHQSPPVNFRPLLPVLERLKGLKEIVGLTYYAKIVRDSGVDELARRVPSLRTFTWKPFIDIDKANVKDVSSFGVRTEVAGVHVYSDISALAVQLRRT